MNTNTAIAPKDDRDFATRLAAGDAAAFTEMMRKHNRRLYRTARAILRDDAEAEDALQEAYLSAYRALPGFRADAKLSTWLVRIVANESLGRLRKRKRSAEVIVLDEGASLHSESVMSVESPVELPERAALRAETRRLIEARIDELPEQFRTVFILRELEEMSVDEVAASLDIPEATVRSRHFRAKGLLRESLSREIDVALEEAFAFDGARCDRIVANVLAALPHPKTPSGGTP
ncbi:RNA polymerase subunit sigma [Betaproteobacteria bacterium GR16-43]|nr:RNA polymerase subunit sigma [Betaproteobacteria bacterium GR16-43]